MGKSLTWATTCVRVRLRIDAAKRRLLAAWPYLMRQQVPSIDMGDLQVVAGFGALVYGVSLVSTPGAWMLAGALLLAGWVIPRIPRREKD